MVTIEAHSRPVGRGIRLDIAATTPSATAPTSRRPSESDPGEKSLPRCRIATNADAHSTSVTDTAATGSRLLDGVAFTGRAYGRPPTPDTRLSDGVRGYPAVLPRQSPHFSAEILAW